MIFIISIGRGGVVYRNDSQVPPSSQHQWPEDGTTATSGGLLDNQPLSNSRQQPQHYQQQQREGTTSTLVQLLQENRGGGSSSSGFSGRSGIRHDSLSSIKSDPDDAVGAAAPAGIVTANKRKWGKLVPPPPPGSLPQPVMMGGYSGSATPNPGIADDLKVCSFRIQPLEFLANFIKN